MLLDKSALLGALAFVLVNATTANISTAQQVEDGAKGFQTPVAHDVAQSGAFSYRVPINVPAFRGLEPRIALSYSSSNTVLGSPKNLVGQGWVLSGFPVIERKSLGRGDPALQQQLGCFWSLTETNSSPAAATGDTTATNPYTGNYPSEAKTEAASPSCDSGGTHTTKWESSQKVVFDSANNFWTVTQIDGRVMEFRPLIEFMPTAPDTSNTHIRRVSEEHTWVLARVYDQHVLSDGTTRANLVEYDYEVEAPFSQDRFDGYAPSRVTYAGYEISMHYFDRGTLGGAEELVFSTGTEANGKQLRILSHVEVRETAGGLIRGYVLDHTLSGTAGLALLASVTEFGSDLVVSGDFANGYSVTSGSSLPATVFGYSSDELGFVNAPMGAAPEEPIYRPELVEEARDFRARISIVADVDADGRDEILLPAYEHIGHLISNTHYVSGAGNDYHYTRNRYRRISSGGGELLDFDGNGQTTRTVLGSEFELRPIDVEEASCQVYNQLDHCDNDDPFTQHPTISNPGEEISFAGTSDIDPESGQRLVATKDDDSTSLFGFETSASDFLRRDDHVDPPQSSHFGRYQHGKGAQYWADDRVYNVTLHGFASQGVLTLPTASLQFAFDMDGNGLTDYATGTGGDRYFRGRGMGFKTDTDSTVDVENDNYVTVGGDHNGDGLQDLIQLHKPSQSLKLHYSEGSGKATPTLPNGTQSYPITGINGSEFDSIRSEDFNSDGLADVIVFDSETRKGRIYMSNGHNFLPVNDEQSVELEIFEFLDVGDFDGDGLADIVGQVSDGTESAAKSTYSIAFGTGVAPNRMISITTPTGATTAIEYSTDAGKPDNQSPQPSIIVSTVTHDDGRGSVPGPQATTTSLPATTPNTAGSSASARSSRPCLPSRRTAPRLRSRPPIRRTRRHRGSWSA